MPTFRFNKAFRRSTRHALRITTPSSRFRARTDGGQEVGQGHFSRLFFPSQGLHGSLAPCLASFPRFEHAESTEKLPHVARKWTRLVPALRPSLVNFVAVNSSASSPRVFVLTCELTSWVVPDGFGPPKGEKGAL